MAMHSGKRKKKRWMERRTVKEREIKLDQG